MNQYGPQGTPVSVPSTPPPPHETGPTPRGPVESITIPTSPAQPSSAPLPGDAGIAVDPREVAAPVAPEPVLSAEERLAAAEATIESLTAQINAAKVLVTHWDDRAARTLIKSDYQKGQRDATLACQGDLRGALGI